MSLNNFINLQTLKAQTKPIHDLDMLESHRQRTSKEILLLRAKNNWEYKELYIQSDKAHEWNELDHFLKLYCKGLISVQHELLFGTHVKVSITYEGY